MASDAYSDLLLEELNKGLSSAAALVVLSGVLAWRLATGKILNCGESSDLEFLAKGAMGISVGLRQWIMGFRCLNDKMQLQYPSSGHKTENIEVEYRYTAYIVPS